MTARTWLLVGSIVLLGIACGDDPAAPAPTVASVAVTSPLGRLWDVGAAVQLAAVARTAQGDPVSATFAWTSSNPTAVSVGATTGAVQALMVGTANIQAQTGAVAGTVAVQVVDADLAGIVALGSDPYLAALVAGTTTAVRTRLQAAATMCAAGAQQGNLEAIQQCVAAVRTEAGSATDPTDRALLAVLSLFADHFERLLNL